MSKILVTGAPGNVGTEVVKALQAQAVDFRIGAFDVAAARATFGDSVDIVRFDFLDPATYHDAFEGVERMFLVRPPALANVRKEIAPALDAAQQAGVRHIVFLSLQGVENNRVVPHYKIEQHILQMQVAYTFLRASFFMQNLSTTHCAEIRDRGEIDVPVGKAATSFVDVRDIAAVAARALMEAGHENAVYTLTGSEALTYYQVAEIMSEQLEHPVVYRNPFPWVFLWQQLTLGNKLGYALVVTALYTITRFGNAKHVTDDVKRVLGRDPISFRKFVQDYRQHWMRSV